MFWTLQSTYEPHILKIQINLKTALVIDEKYLCLQLQNMAFQRCQLLHVYGKRKPKKNTKHPKHKLYFSCIMERFLFSLSYFEFATVKIKNKSRETV